MILGWSFSEEVLRDLRSHASFTGWDDRFYVNVGALLVPVAISLATKKGYALCRALACHRKSEVVGTWQTVDLNLKPIGEPTNDLPDTLIPFLSLGETTPYEDDFPSIVSAASLACNPDWLGGGFAEHGFSTEGQIFQQFDSDLLLRVLYDDFE